VVNSFEFSNTPSVSEKNMENFVIKLHILVKKDSILSR
jgi:hypothetical protein